MQTPEDSTPEKNPQTTKRLRTSKTSKRFSDEQIKSLESIFKVEDKLEQRKKVQIAKDLGLQPRQVAIWFQNRRARWKSKQIEQDYRVLKTNYDSLCLKFDDMKREKQSLEMQLQELKDVMQNFRKVSLSERDGEFKENPDSSNEVIYHNGSICLDDEGAMSRCFGKTEEEVPNWGEEDEEITHLTSQQTWCDLSSAALFDNSSDISDWWES